MVGCSGFGLAEFAFVIFSVAVGVSIAGWLIRRLICVLAGLAGLGGLGWGPAWPQDFHGGPGLSASLRHAATQKSDTWPACQPVAQQPPDPPPNLVLPSWDRRGRSDISMTNAAVKASSRQSTQGKATLTRPAESYPNSTHKPLLAGRRQKTIKRQAHNCQQ